MTAWNVLTANSTAPPGSTAWTHLNAQQGGGSGGTVNAIASLTTSASKASLTVSNANGSLDFKPTSPTLTLTIKDNEEISLGVNNGSIDYHGG